MLLLSCAASASPLCVADSIARERAADYYYLQAVSLLEQEKYDAAYDMFEHCRSLSPSSSAVLYELANIYQYIGQRDEALAILRGIVQDNPKNYLFWESLLRFLEEDGNADALLQVYEEMARVFPEKSELYSLNEKPVQLPNTFASVNEKIMIIRMKTFQLMTMLTWKMILLVMKNL